MRDSSIASEEKKKWFEQGVVSSKSVFAQFVLKLRNTLGLRLLFYLRRFDTVLYKPANASQNNQKNWRDKRGDRANRIEQVFFDWYGHC